MIELIEAQKILNSIMVKLINTQESASFKGLTFILVQHKEILDIKVKQILWV
jgi:hypothetical protein